MPNANLKKTKETELFIASKIDSLDDFLKTSLCEGKHIYCSFTKQSMDYYLLEQSKKRKIQSISFCDGYTIYPSQKLTKLRSDRE